jgi:hypothetical protein
MARTKSKTVNDSNAARDTCIHHWVIDSPEGPTSRGICQLCGAEDEFNNYISYPSWHDTKWGKRKPDALELEYIKASPGPPNY